MMLYTGSNSFCLLVQNSLHVRLLALFYQIQKYNKLLLILIDKNVMCNITH